MVEKPLWNKGGSSRSSGVMVPILWDFAEDKCFGGGCWIWLMPRWPLILVSYLIQSFSSIIGCSHAHCQTGKGDRGGNQQEVVKKARPAVEEKHCRAATSVPEEIARGRGSCRSWEILIC